MKITKMQGLGNDYLYFHEEVPADVSNLSILLSDRHYGAGFGESGEGWIRFSMFVREEDVEEAGRRIVWLKNEKYF